MALFKYRAVDAEGASLEGTEEAATAREVVTKLQDQGLAVNAVEPAEVPTSPFTRKQRLRWEDLELLNDQLLTITRSGMPLAPALAALGHDLRNARVKALLADVQRDLEAGKSLEQAFSEHPKTFPPIYTALVRAGERAGNLSGVFEVLTDYSRQMVELKSSMQEVLAYPLFLLVAAAGIVLFLLAWVIPQFMEVFSGFGAQLPLPTELLAQISLAVRGHPLVSGGVVAAAGVALIFVLSIFLRSGPSSFGRDRFKLRFPVAGQLYTAASLARFCRSLSMLLEAHVPMLESLELAAAASGNAVLADAVGQAGEGVSRGDGLAESLQQTGYFDHSFCWLLGNAEQRGELVNALTVLEEDQERTIERMRKWIMLMAGPIVVIFLALIIGFIVVSLYLPIFTLGDVISG